MSAEKRKRSGEKGKIGEATIGKMVTEGYEGLREGKEV